MNWIIVATVLCFASYGLTLIMNEVMSAKALIYSVVILAVVVGVISCFNGGYHYLTSWVGLGIGLLHVQDIRLNKK